MPHIISNFLNRLPSIESILFVSMVIGAFVFLANLPRFDDKKRIMYIAIFIEAFFAIAMIIATLS